MKPEYEPKTLQQKLGYLVEECGEVLAAVGKTMRWGLESSNPELIDGETNRAWVLRELTDLERAIRYAREALGDATDPFDGADFYDARDTGHLTLESPEEAVEEYIELWLDPKSDVSAVIRERSPVTVTAWRLRPGWTDEDDNCDRCGTRTYGAEQVEAMLRRHCPEWWEVVEPVGTQS